MLMNKAAFIANTPPLDSVFKLNPSILASPTPFRNVKFIDIEGIMVKCLSHAYFWCVALTKFVDAHLKSGQRPQHSRFQFEN